ncbi:ribosome maturation factor RimM [Candidatus Profftella armatura (Diaphorina cf. continua)]|uniref:Ribosome maturation factor RimM n=1 Tax=Candidatus Profftella armatura (Diaphorina cf. continua) TaxID=2661583 RepID=A0A7R7ABT1_9PROT|nr:ribosome maturation factor RimM [Candidatus Profftella armatura (Diaphorina cf. continua)]BCG49758.1 ribosome maturation factor RimM [Candidatus Profftella armatura (Diaphorina cf. continua)]
MKKINYINNQSKIFTKNLVTIGVVLRAYGIFGWILIKLFLDNKNIFFYTKKIWFFDPNSLKLFSVKILHKKNYKNYVLVNLYNITDRNLAIKLQGFYIQISIDYFPKLLSSDTFYWFNLIDCIVENIHGKLLGTVTEIIQNKAHSILRIIKLSTKIICTKKYKNKYGILIPFIKIFIKNVDIIKKKIIVDWN